MTFFLLLLSVYCLTQDKTVTAIEQECSSRNETESGGNFKLDGEKVRFGCVKWIKVYKGFYIKMSFGASKTTEVVVEEFSDGTKSHVQKLRPNQVMYESKENEIVVRINANSASLEVHWWRECGKSHHQTLQFFEVTGPSILSGYPNHSRCNWEVSSDPDYQIMLEVQEILAYNQTLGDCSYDYVQVTGILEGETGSTTTCLTERTSKYYYNSPVYILFYSDSKSDSGIIFTFRTSLVKFLRKYQGRIESPGYPSEYPNNSLLTWILEAPMGFRTQLTFDDFRLEKENTGKCYDFIKIIEPRQAQVNSSERDYCGTSMVNSSKTSLKQRMGLLFASDQGVSDKGFSAYWVTVCGGTLDGNFGELVGPNNASGYPENQTCTWNIKVQNGYKLSLALNVNGYNDGTNCSLDHIQVEEEQGDHEINGKRFCSGALSLESTKSVIIIFHSDNDPTTGLSFNASWLSKCGETFKSNSGELASPDYPVDYDHEVRCNWTILVSSRHTITLNYSLQKTSNDETPCTPYVQVTETDFSATKILCKINTFAIHRSSSNTLHVSLTHEPRMNYSRFYAKWHAENTLTYKQAESGSGSTQDSLVILLQEDRKFNESSLPIAAVIVQTAAPPMAFVIVVLIIVFIVRRRKSMFCFSKETEEATYDAEEIIYDSINEKGINVEISRLPTTKNIHHFSKKRFEPQTFRRRLPNPPIARLSSVLARVRKSMHFGNERDRAYGESTEGRHISFIGDHTEFHKRRREITHSKQERFSHGLQSTMESFTNSGYISAVEVDQGKKECVCSRNIVETDCVVFDTTVETSDNEGYITAVNSFATERSPSIVDSDSIKSRSDIQRQND